jgi:hypothetical protein
MDDKIIAPSSSPCEKLNGRWKEKESGGGKWKIKIW